MTKTSCNPTKKSDTFSHRISCKLAIKAKQELDRALESRGLYGKKEGENDDAIAKTIGH